MTRIQYGLFHTVQSAGFGTGCHVHIWFLLYSFPSLASNSCTLIQHSKVCKPRPTFQKNLEIVTDYTLYKRHDKHILKSFNTRVFNWVHEWKKHAIYLLCWIETFWTKLRNILFNYCAVSLLKIPFLFCCFSVGLFQNCDTSMCVPFIIMAL